LFFSENLLIQLNATSVVDVSIGAEALVTYNGGQKRNLQQSDSGQDKVAFTAAATLDAGQPNSSFGNILLASLLMIFITILF